MFDTVRLGLEDVSLDTGLLMRRGFAKATSERMDAEGIVAEYVSYRMFRTGESPHFLQYCPASGRVTLETSLPKIHFGGENVSLLGPCDVGPALDELSNRVNDLVGCAPHCGGWDIRGRVDAVFSWDTRWDGKNHVADYLHAFKTTELPRHYSQAVDGQATLYWRNGQRVIRMYDKEKESGMREAKGQLRFEAQLRHAKKELGDVAGVTSIKARDALTWQTARALLQSYLDGLGADLVITDDEQLFQFLREKVGNTKAVRLIGVAFMSRLYSRDELLRQGFKRDWLWRNTREVNKAGASAGESQSGLLPPLVLPGSEYDGGAGNLRTSRCTNRG